MRRNKLTTGNVLITVIMILWGLLIVYPFYNSILVSFMTHAEFMSKPFALYVSNPTLVAYKEIFSDDKFFNAYKITLEVLVIRLPLVLLVDSAMAYALSRKDFFGRKVINNLAVFTMYFGGGIVPLYLLVKQYGMLDSISCMIIVGYFGVYNTILMKNFFFTIPDSLEESAKIDGANDLRIYAQIYIPLAKPIIATIALFSAVGIWNAWYGPMIYISDSKKWPLQLVLREVINNATAPVKEDMADEMAKLKDTFALNVQMASVVVTMLPIMLVYPFVQKYFMSGLTIGAVKG